MLSSVLAAPALNQIDEVANAYAKPILEAIQSPSPTPAVQEANVYLKPSPSETPSPLPTVSDEHSYPTPTEECELAQETTATESDINVYGKPTDTPHLEPTHAPEPEPESSPLVEAESTPTPECTEESTPIEEPVESSPTPDAYGAPDNIYQSSANQKYISVAIAGALFFQ